MKIMMICGTYPPENCGVGDYTHRLVNELTKSENIEIKVLTNIDWAVSNFKNICSEIDAYKPQIIHIQFPSAGYKLSIAPQLLSLKYKSIVTIHEASQFHPIRKLWLFPFSFKSKLIFTTAYEKKYFKSIFSWYKKKSDVIQLGSHIDISNINEGIGEKDIYSIIYFGQIRPKKGIEELINLGRLIKTNNLNYRIKIAGHVLERFSGYHDDLKRSSQDLPIDWLNNMSDSDISLLFSKNIIGYLPFPDGASERRTSLFSLLNNKMLVYTTCGKHTPDDLAGSVIYVKNSTEMLTNLLNMNLVKLDEFVKEKTHNAELYLKKFEWSIIAEKHIEVYAEFLNK
jgi:glycosyltransferase involved in cell wall biosynthesis